MAYIKDPEMIFTKMAVNKMSYYKVLDSDGKTVLDSQDNEDVLPEEAAVRLRDTLDNITGTITIVLSCKSPKQKGAGGNTQGDLRFTIKLGNTENTRGINGTEVGTSTFQAMREAIQKEFDAKLEAMKKDYEHREQMRKLQDQINELKNGDMLEKYLPVIAGLFGPQAPAIAGTDQGPHITGTGEAKERITAALNRLLKADPNFIDNLEALADLAEKNKLVYNMAVAKLKSL